MKKKRSTDPEKIYLDTNAFYFFFFDDDKYSGGVRQIIQEVQKGSINAFTSCIALEELAYVTLMRLIQRRYNAHPRGVIRSNPAAALEFANVLKEIFDTIFSFDNLTILDTQKDIVAKIPFILEESLLLPADCIHLQTMRDAGCKKILSTDSDFDGLEGIKRIDGRRVYEAP